MTKVDRRILKSQEAIKNAFVDLLSEKNFDQITIQDISNKANVSRRTIYLHYMDKFDLLDKLIEGHINKLQELAEANSELDFIKGNIIWFEYFEEHFLFFSTMLNNKRGSSFRSQFLEFVFKALDVEVTVEEGRNKGLDKDIISRFIAGAYVELVEWWVINKMPYSPKMMAERVGILIERII